MSDQPAHGESDLQRELDRVARLHRLSVLDTEAEPLFDALTRAASLITGAPIALVSLVDADRQWFKSNHGLEGTSETPRDVAFCAHTILGDALLEVPDARADVRFAGNPLVTGSPDIRFYAGAPIVLNDGLRMGSLCVIDRVPRTLTDMQREALQHLASAASEALDQRRLALERSDALRRDVETQRLRAIDQARLANILDAMQAGTWEWHVKTGALQCNARWVDMIGYAPGEIAPLSFATWRALAHPDDWQRAWPSLQQHLAGDAPHFDSHMRLRHKGGAWIWVACRGRVVEHGADGEPSLMVGTHVDITTRKEIERRLLASEALLDRTGRLAAVGGWEVDLDSGEITWSDETCRIHDVPLGYRPTMEEAVEFYEPAARETLRLAIEKAVLDGNGWDLELPFVTGAGRRLWVRAFGTVEYEDARPRWLIGALQDVTLRRRAVQALEISERRFRKLFEEGLGLICMHDMDGVLLSVNPASADALGYSVARMMGHRLTDFMPPEYHAAFHAYLERIAVNVVDSGVLRLIANDGSLHTWEYRNVLDEEGDQRYVLGHAQDVTEREITERKLHERSVRDELTGCFNRAFLADLVATMQDDDVWGFVAIDLDRFKLVNDTWGHQRGDEVLVEMSRFLAGHLRPDDVVVRAGGDEFLLLLKGADALATANVCDRLRATSADAPIGFTLGSAVRRRGSTLDETWATADRQLYERRALRAG